MAKKRPSRKFTPYRPPAPPAGTYDPSLDAQVAAAQRGFGDLRSDVETQGLQAQQDYGLSVESINRQRGWNLEDLGRDYQRGLADLDTRFTRGSEDYNRGVAQLQRNYDRLARGQRQAGNAAGVIRGGAMLQAAAKRAGNQAWERQPLDTGWNREQQDIGTSRSRIGEDYNTGVARTNAAADWDIGMAGLGYQRQGSALNTQLTRAGRENTAFGLDVAAQRAYQAAGAGWDPGAGPSNEYSRGGQTYRIVREGNQSVAYLPSGKVLWRRPFRGR